jgi:uncharacterized membrane protein YgdD (TMEM256/DUF423 family)
VTSRLDLPLGRGVSRVATTPALVAQRTGAGFGFLGVALGAFAAHALKPHLTQLGTVEIWRTGVLYQFVHAVALLAIGQRDLVSLKTVVFFGVGIFLFSGSLYLLAWNPAWIAAGPFTPLGGFLFLAGWISYLWDLRGRSTRP